MNTMLEKRKGLLKNKKGFTLIELIVVIVIIGILAAVLIPRMTGFTKKAQGTEALVHAKQVATAIDSIIADGQITYSAISTSAILELSQIPTTTTISAIEADGGFTVKAESGEKAGRDSAEDKVEMKK